MTIALVNQHLNKQSILSLLRTEMNTSISLWVMVAAFLLFLPNLSKAQAYRKLTTSDFVGIPPANEAFAAFTYCDVNYSYNAVKHNGVYNITFSVEMLFNPYKSWIRFDQVSGQNILEYVLKHEQGHYNIAYLMKNELYGVLTHYKYTANYQSEIEILFKGVREKYHKINAAYEAETQHMNHVKNQEKWNVWFDRHLTNNELADVNSRDRFQ